MSDIGARTRQQYMDIVKDYLLNEVLNKVSKENYEDIFQGEYISDFQKNFRKSIVARSALAKLKDYFVNIGVLPKYFNFEYEKLEHNHFDTFSMINKEQLDIIFSEEIAFRTINEKYVTRCICALLYFCLFEQRHIMNLTRNDILLEERLVRNIRTDENENEELLKWIALNDFAYKYVSEYVEYAEKNSIDISERFIILENKPINNTTFNSCFQTFNLKKCNPLQMFKLSGQKLNLSMIYYWLVSSEGKAMSTIIQMVGLSNEQWKKAFKLYIENYSTVYNPRSVAEIIELSTMINDFDKIEEDYIQEVESPENKGDIYNDNDSENNFDECIPYSEANDIKMDDIIDYDSMSKQNKQEKEVSLSRLVRSTHLSSDLRKAYNDTCQLCGTRLMKSRFDSYSEAHHIRPYNKTHKGDDTISNMIVLCPNCHSQFDSLYYAIDPDTKYVQCQDKEDRFHMAHLYFFDEHTLDRNYLNYTWKLFKDNMW